MLSLLYALSKKEKHELNCSLVCKPFLLERVNYNYYSHIYIVSVFIPVYCLNVCRLGGGSLGWDLPGKLKMYDSYIMQVTKRLFSSSLGNFLWNLVHRELSIFYFQLNIWIGHEPDK